ncbi:MAG: thiamine-phosphate kinase [Saprospiraceae bacterium]|nr:thiamine-phosphate kinase [Saprospiraceae bacterium]
MNKETDIIKKIIGILPKSGFLQNRFFESDAEIINHNSKKLLFSIDEFSQEDFFRDDYPFELGYNIAVATISDVLASGGKPLYYAHSISIDNEKWDSNFIEAFSQGIAKVLKNAGAGFIGGDLGKSESWKYTGVIIGETENPITRIGAKEGDLLFMTGQLGAGNIEAAMKLFLNYDFLGNKIKVPRLKLNLRNKESEFINKFATSCIDSSDGVLSALITISDLNNVGFEITNLPYTKEGIKLCELISKPKCMLFMGECGEYELVFTIKKQDRKTFLEEAKDSNLSFTQIGVIQEKQTKSLRTEDENIDFNKFEIKARDYNNTEEYLTDLLTYVSNNKK